MSTSSGGPSIMQAFHLSKFATSSFLRLFSIFCNPRLHSLCLFTSMPITFHTEMRYQLMFPPETSCRFAFHPCAPLSYSHAVPLLLLYLLNNQFHHLLVRFIFTFLGFRLLPLTDWVFSVISTSR